MHEVEEGIVQISKDLFKTDSQSIQIEVVKSQQRSDVFHFKVMQLASHEDRNQNDPRVGSECTLRFHFFFELLRLQQDDRLKAYDWDVNSKP